MLHEFSDIVDPKELPRKLSHLKWHITGFVDGDGSFPVILSPDPTKRFGWLIQPRFEIELKRNLDSKVMLKVTCRAIGIRPKMFEGDNYVKLVVTNRRLLREKVVAFFTEYPPTLKEDKFALMRHVVKALDEKKHLEHEGFKDIIRRIFSLPVDGETRRKWSFNEVMQDEEPPMTQKERTLSFPKGIVALKHYVLGFIDAEGSFGYAINRETRSITPYLTVTHREPEILRMVQRTLDCGNVSKGRLQVYGVENMVARVVPLIDELKLIAKRTAYGQFRSVLAMIVRGEHRRNYQRVETFARSLNRRLGDPQRPYARHPSNEG